MDYVEKNLETIDDILEYIEDILDNSFSLPLVNKALVDKKYILELITDIRLKLPTEIKQSKWVIEERNKILIEAQKEAEGKMKETEKTINQMVNENEITKKAYEQSEEIIENAKKVSREMRLGAKEYADEVLKKLQEKMENTLTETNESYRILEEKMIHQLKTLEQNREQLKN